MTSFCTLTLFFALHLRDRELGWGVVTARFGLEELHSKRGLPSKVKVFEGRRDSDRVVYFLLLPLGRLHHVQ